MKRCAQGAGAGSGVPAPTGRTSALPLLTTDLIERPCAAQRVCLPRRYGLREKAGAQPQTYALGLKEVWEVSEH